MVLCQLCCYANIVYAIFPFVFTPDWRDVVLADITPSLAFFGLRNTAWAGHIVLKNAAGEWRLVVSSGANQAMRAYEAATCQ